MHERHCSYCWNWHRLGNNTEKKRLSQGNIFIMHLEYASLYMLQAPVVSDVTQVRFRFIAALPQWYWFLLSWKDAASNDTTYRAGLKSLWGCFIPPPYWANGSPSGPTSPLKYGWWGSKLHLNGTRFFMYIWDALKYPLSYLIYLCNLHQNLDCIKEKQILQMK